MASSVGPAAEQLSTVETLGEYARRARQYIGNILLYGFVGAYDGVAEGIKHTRQDWQARAAEFEDLTVYVNNLEEHKKI